MRNMKITLALLLLAHPVAAQEVGIFGTFLGATIGGAMSRRVSARGWLHVGYDRHVYMPVGEMSDGAQHSRPKHVVRLGMLFRPRR